MVRRGRGLSRQTGRCDALLNGLDDKTPTPWDGSEGDDSGGAGKQGGLTELGDGAAAVAMQSAGADTELPCGGADRVALQQGQPQRSGLWRRKPLQHGREQVVVVLRC